MNLVQLVFHNARTRSDAPALSDGERRFTRIQLADIVARTAGHLVACGIGPGMRVGVCLKDSWEHVVALLAIGHAGAVIVPMDWRAKPAAKAQLAETLALALVLVEADAAPVASARSFALTADWHAAVARADPPGQTPQDWDAPLLIGATSGTTGAPKYALATHQQTYFRAALTMDTARHLAPHRYLSASPLCFAGGSNRLLAHLLWGDEVVLHPPLFSAAEYVDALRRHEVTIGFAVPMVVRQLLHIAGSGGRLLPDGVALVTSGAPLFAEEKQEALRRLTADFIEVYGCSALGGVSCLRPWDIAEAPESVGRPYPLVEIEVVDEADRPLPPDSVGRLRLGGAGLGRPLDWSHGAGHEEFRGGWYYPGEFALLDARGYLFIKGRTTDVIMRGGAKIHPAEIEAALRDHAAVAEAAVIGGRAADNEETVTAFVIARGPLETGDLLAHCRARLTPHKVPQEIRLVASLPRNTAGKISRVDLARLLAGPARGPG